MVSLLQRCRNIYESDGLLDLILSSKRFTYYQLRPLITSFCISDGYPSFLSSEKVVWINPSRITHYTEFGPKTPGMTYGGCWDIITRNFMGHHKTNSMYNHFVNDVPWEDTAYYKRQLRVIQRDGNYRGCTDSSDLIKFLQRYDALYADIKQNGYKSQEKVSREKNIINATGQARSTYSEVGVNVGRNGQFLWADNGRHRLCIAKLLGVEEIPVQILSRHKKWENYIRNLQENPGKLRSSDHQSHPDLSSSL